jgi:NAD-dependent DNA ligase
MSEKVSNLVIKIIKAKKHYYAGNPIISDYDYDMLEASLKKIDELHPVNFLVGYSEEYDWWIKHYEEV